MLLFVACILSLCQPRESVDIRNGVAVLEDIVFAVPSNQDVGSKQLMMNAAFPNEFDGKLPVVIYIHGGGWNGGSKSEGDRFIELLARGKYFAMAIDFRLTQDGGFPDTIYDIKSALRFVRKYSNELNINPNKVGIVGYSSGGHLAALVGLSSGDELLDGSFSDADISTSVTCIGLINGAVKPKYLSREFRSGYLKWANQTSSDVSVTYPEKYLDSGDPPIYLLSGRDDSVCPTRLARQFKGQAERSKIQVSHEILPNAGHRITGPASYLGLFGFLDAHLGGDAKEMLESQIHSAGAGSKD